MTSKQTYLTALFEGLGYKNIEIPYSGNPTIVAYTDEAGYRHHAHVYTDKRANGVRQVSIKCLREGKGQCNFNRMSDIARYISVLGLAPFAKVELRTVRTTGMWRTNADGDTHFIALTSQDKFPWSIKAPWTI